MLKEKNINNPSELGQSRVFVEFFSPKCAHCRAIEPSVIKLASEFPDTEFIKINTENSPESIESFSLRGLPTFVLYERGKEIKRSVGARPAAIREMLL